MHLRSPVTLGVVIGLSVVVSLALEHRARIGLCERQACLDKLSDQAAHLTAERERLSNLVAQASSGPLSEDQLRELLTLRNEVGLLRQACAEKSKLETANAQLRAAEARESNRLAEAQVLPNYWPKERLTFAGYGDPESAMKTLLWAMNESDSKLWRQACTPEALDKLDRQWATRGVSEEQRAAETKIMADALTSPSVGFHILETPKAWGSLAIIHLSFDGEGRTRTFVLRKIGDDWKFDNIVFDGQEGAGLSFPRSWPTSEWGTNK